MNESEGPSRNGNWKALLARVYALVGKWFLLTVVPALLSAVTFVGYSWWKGDTAFKADVRNRLARIEQWQQDAEARLARCSGERYHPSLTAAGPGSSTPSDPK